MDLPIDLDELDVIIESVSDVDTELCRKLRLVKGLVEDGKPYKKILRRKIWLCSIMFFKKLSLVTGGFDPIHSGHIAYFERAKRSI